MSVGSKNSTGQSSFTKILGFLSFRRKTLGEKRFLLCGKSFVKCYKQETSTQRRFLPKYIENTF